LILLLSPEVVRTPVSDGTALASSCASASNASSFSMLAIKKFKKVGSLLDPEVE
jgi:hypothetical protein